jgi:hypothetical protein
MTIKQSEANRFAMLVVSCDRYSDLWRPCFHLLDKYWRDRDFDVYLMSNSLDFEWPGVKVIKIGEDVSYADNLRAAIEHIPEQWLLLWLEDLLLCAPVEHKRVCSMIATAQSRRAGYLKLSPDMPLSYEKSHSGEVGPLPKGIRYRSAIGASFYNRSTLLRLLTPGASAWDLDKSQISDELPEEFLALTADAARVPPIPHLNAVVKGRWTFGTKAFLRSEGVDARVDERRSESIGSMLYRKAFVARLALYRLLRTHWR